MDDQRKYALLFAATILAARKLNEIGSKVVGRAEQAVVGGGPCFRGSGPGGNEGYRESSRSGAEVRGSWAKMLAQSPTAVLPRSFIPRVREVLMRLAVCRIR